MQRHEQSAAQRGSPECWGGREGTAQGPVAAVALHDHRAAAEPPGVLPSGSPST